MIGFLGLRLLRAGLTIALVVSFAFVVLRLSGDPAMTIMSPEAPPEAIAAFRTAWGLDRPVWEQYFSYFGAILHGEQYPNEKWRRLPTTYYTLTSGFGRAVNLQRDVSPITNNSQRIGMIGLGVGTVAAYCREGDICRIYEINAEVERLARKHFTYLADSKGKVPEILSL